MKKVGETLEERGEVYGDYLGGSQFRARVMTLIRARHMDVHRTEMDPTQEVMIYDIVNKLSRLCVTPNHKDTWLDIAGYAELTREALGGEDE